MAIKRGFRFPAEFDAVFPKGLVLLGEIAPDTIYNSNPDAPKVQKVDEETGLRQWKATATDPDEDKAKRASFEIIFLSSHQPVPTGAEIVPNTGMRMVELEGLTAEPTVVRQGSGEKNYSYVSYKFRAIGIKGDSNTPKSNGRNASAESKAVA